MKKSSLKGTPSGFRDIGPEESALKRWVVRTIEGIYMRYGFVPIETPIVEFAEILADEVTDFNLFMVSPSKERQKGTAVALAMRFDQTVPLARFVSENSAITKPFKRYVFGPVFRGESPQAGRYRQFDQFDADIVGSSNISSDIEVLLVMRDVMKAIVGDKFTIRTNTRKLLNCLPVVFGFEESNLKEVLIALDKRDKISPENLKKLLTDLGLSDDTAVGIMDFGSLSGAPSDVLANVKKICGSYPEAEEAINDLEVVAQTLTACGVAEIEFDMSIIRGLSYYTGMVFETVLHEAKEFGSVYSAGRYDGLVAKFGAQETPAVGASVGVDRLVAALTAMKYKPKDDCLKAIVMVTDVKMIPYAFLISDYCHNAGIPCEVYTGNKRKLGDQFAYADSKGYDYTLIADSSDQENQTVKVRDQKTKIQVVSSLDSFTQKLM